MKKLRKYTNGIVLLLMSVMLLACDTEQDLDVLSDDAVRFSVGINTSRASRTETRSDDEEDQLLDLNLENELQDGVNGLTTLIFFFDENGDRVHLVNGGISSNFSILALGTNSLDFSIPIDKYSLLREVGKVRMTIVANVGVLRSLTLSTIKTYEDLETRVISTTFNDGSNPLYFLMDGSVDIDFSNYTYNFNNQRIKLKETVKLTRAAAKIRVLVNHQDLYSHKADREKHGTYFKYSIGDLSLKFYNFTEETYLVGGGLDFGVITPTYHADYLDASHYVLRVDDYNGGDEDVEELYRTTEFPLYSYETSWLINSELKTPYILLRMQIKDNTIKGSEMVNYLYKVPITLRAKELKRNHYYLIKVNISEKGAPDTSDPQEPEKPEEPELPVDPVVLIPEIIVMKDWEEEIVVVAPDLDSSDYLELPEREVRLSGQNRYNIPYKSSKPISAVLEKIEYDKYDKKGNKERVVVNNPRDLGMISSDVLVNPDSNEIKFTARNGFNLDRPVTYYLKVFHKDTSSPRFNEYIKVIYYPERGLSAKPSKAFYVNEYDDFRYHDALGTFSASGKVKNDARLTRITTYTHLTNGVVSVGDPTDSNLYTREDLAANNIISPDFIIASDHGETIALKQKEGLGIDPWLHVNLGSSKHNFADNYGPVLAYFTTLGAYNRSLSYKIGSTEYNNLQAWYRYTGSAKDRCYNYFEDDYGPHITIDEKFVHENKYLSGKAIHVRPKYKGRWRLPTRAEMALISEYYRKKGSLLENLLSEKHYWTAMSGVAYEVGSVYEGGVRPEKAHVRCVFDVWKVKNHEDW